MELLLVVLQNVLKPHEVFVPPMGTNSLKTCDRNVNLYLHFKMSTQVNIQIVGLSRMSTLLSVKNAPTHNVNTSLTKGMP